MNWLLAGVAATILLSVAAFLRLVEATFMRLGRARASGLDEVAGNGERLNGDRNRSHHAERQAGDRSARERDSRDLASHERAALDLDRNGRNGRNGRTGRTHAADGLADASPADAKPGASHPKSDSAQRNPKTGVRARATLVELVGNREAVLGPASLLRLLVQVTLVGAMAWIAALRTGPIGIIVTLAVTAAVLFGVTEALPRRWGVEANDRMARALAPVARLLSRTVPLVWLARLLGAPARALVPATPHDDASEVIEDELVALASAAAEASLIDDSEAELIGQIMELGDTIVREVMVPRPDMISVDIDDSVTEALERIIASGFTRLPVTGDSIDDIRGIVLTKDLVAAYLHGADPGGQPRQSAQPMTCAQVLRPATFVPETKRVSELMREMQNSKSHLAIAVDEYGGVAGLVTLEDIIEELVGEITDEYDADEALVQDLGDDTFLFSGRLSASRLAEVLELRLPEGDWDTVGGLVLDRMGHVPETGETTDLDGWCLAALKVEGRRIQLVRARRRHEQTPSAPGE